MFASNSQYVHYHGIKKVKDELDIVNMIRTIQKLKAGLSAVIDDNIAL